MAGMTLIRKARIERSLSRRSHEGNEKMATWHDVRRIALGLPDTAEKEQERGYRNVERARQIIRVGTALAQV
jgi:hypothetical protein